MTPYNLRVHGCIYDIEVSIQEDLLHFWERRELEPSFAFVASTPVKVLSAITRHLFVTRPPSSKLQQVERETESVEVPTSLDIRFRGETQSLGSISTDDTQLASVTAVKNDDAEVDLETWNRWCVNNFCNNNGRQGLICVPGTYEHGTHGSLFDCIRSLLLRWYRRNVTRGFLHYLREEHKDLADVEVRLSISGSCGPVEKSVVVSGWVNRKVSITPSSLNKRKRAAGVLCSDVWDHSVRRDLVVGADAISRLCRSTWWTWDDGSTLLFWRWPRMYRYRVRDGSPVYIRGQYLPHYFKRQAWPKDKTALAKCKRKILKVRGRRYIVLVRLRVAQVSLRFQKGRTTFAWYTTPLSVA